MPTRYFCQKHGWKLNRIQEIYGVKKNTAHWWHVKSLIEIINLGKKIQNHPKGCFMSFACLVRFCLLHDMPTPQRSTFLPFTFQPRCRIRQAGVAQSTRDQKRKSKKWQAGCKDFCFHPWLGQTIQFDYYFFRMGGWFNHQLGRLGWENCDTARDAPQKPSISNSYHDCSGGFKYTPEI